MGLTSIPTRVSGSLGATKVDLNAFTYSTGVLPSGEWNNAAQAIAEVAPQVGLIDGSTTGSIQAWVYSVQSSSLIIFSATSSLPNAKVIAAGSNITINDYGTTIGISSSQGSFVSSVSAVAPLTSSGGLTPTLSISSASQTSNGSMSATDKTKLDGLPSLVASVSASYVVLGADAGLTNERVLGAGPGIYITDYGAGNGIAISASLLAGDNVTINQVSNSYAISASVSQQTVTTIVTSSGWVTLYEVDFTSLTTASLSTNGAYTINGVTWDAINNANASYMALSGSGKGLEIKVNANSSDYWASTRTAPGLYLPLKYITALSNSYYDYNQYDMRVIVQCSASNQNATFEAVVVALEKSSSLPNPNFIDLEHGYLLQTNTNKVSGSTGTNGPAVTPNAETVFVITAQDGFGMTVGISASASKSGSFDPFNIYQRQLARWDWWSSNTSARGEIPFIANFLDLNLGLVVKSAAANRNVIGNFYRMYVQVRPKTATNIQYNPLFKTANYTLLNSDNFIFVSASTAVTMTLPTSPVNGQTHIIKDRAGNCTINNIVISSSNNTIDGSSTYLLNTNYGAINLVYMSASANQGWGII